MKERTGTVNCMIATIIICIIAELIGPLQFKVMGIENKAAHRAYYDALATAKLYQTLAHYFENEDPSLFKPQQLTYKIKKVQPATAKQVALLQRLYSQKKKVPEWNPDTITRSEASRLIDSLLKSKVI